MCSAIWIWGLLLQLVLMATDDTFALSLDNVTANESAAELARSATDSLVASSRPDQAALQPREAARAAAAASARECVVDRGHAPPAL